MKKTYFLVAIALAFVWSASAALASQYAGRYSTIFDLNDDQSINLSDVSQVTTWLESGAHQNCYTGYQEKLTVASTSNSNVNFSASDSWCSSLLGLVMDAVRTQSYNEIADLNADGKVNLSDVSLMSTWYHNDYGQVCYYQFTKKYDHNDIHWCTATYQGIIDTMGEVAGGPDIGVDYIQVSPDMPVLNEAAEIKIQARNTGTTNITNQAIINNVYKVLGNFTISESIIPQVSAADPIVPGEEFYYIYKGKFTKLGNGYISFVYNAQDTDAELNISNNSVTTWVKVYSNNLLQISEANVSKITTNSARVYWKSAGMGSNGEYRYSKNESELASLPWRTDGVSNDPNVTGNMFASQVDLANLASNTKYYVQVRKYYLGSTGPQYSATKSLTFKTLGSTSDDDDSDDDLPSVDDSVKKVQVCHKLGNEKSHTLLISQDALAAHLAHGDQAGVCELVYYNPTDINNLLSNLKQTRNEEEEDKFKKLVLADIKEFAVNMSDDHLDLAAIFIAYGIDDDTQNLGSGERRAVLRDWLKNVGYTNINWEDLARLANGEKPVSRNLSKEQAQVARALKTFETVYGHQPNFKNTEEDLFWNTLMYSIRFPRDLSAEQDGIEEFQKIFGRTPTTPYDWSVVRALGYIK